MSSFLARGAVVGRAAGTGGGSGRGGGGSGRGGGGSGRGGGGRQFTAEKARRATAVRYAVKGRIEFHSSTVIKCNMQTCCATLIFSNCPLFLARHG